MNILMSMRLLSVTGIGFIGACLADIIMNWKLLFSDIVSETGKKHRHAMVVVVLVLDILLNSIIGLTPYVDNYNRKFIESPRFANCTFRILNFVLRIRSRWNDLRFSVWSVYDSTSLCRFFRHGRWLDSSS